MIYEIKKLTFAPTQSGKDRWTIETDKGYINIWDSGIAEGIKDYVGKVCELEVDHRS